MQEKPNPEYLSSKEVADYLKVSTMTISRLYRKGFFPHAIKVSAGKNSALRIPTEDLDNFIKGQNQGAISST
jgi:excisionase family DNA binding protein